MVLVIDTSSARTGLAVLASRDPGAAVAVEEAPPALRAEQLPAAVARLVQPRDLEAVMITLGPGSFTGLRVGASYGIGLARGRHLSLLGVATLALVRARATRPVTALVEAGRGRVYLEDSDGRAAVAVPSELPRDRAAWGWLSETTAAAVRAAGVDLLEESSLASFGEAASRCLGTAVELGYGTVKLLYISSAGVVLEKET